MKILLFLLMILVSNSVLYSSEIVKIRLMDGETLTGKLDLPSTGDIKQLIIFIHGTGPNTYTNHRKVGDTEFNYFDLFVNEFNKRGIAFFTYNRRGVEIGDKPPYYDVVDREKYKKYLPSIEVKDIESVITHLKTDNRLRTSKVVLFGGSEGTILAPMVAENMKNKIDALFLFGYVNDNLFDVIKWQNSGEPTMMAIRDYLKYFDTDKDNIVSKQEYEADDKIAELIRSTKFKGTKYEKLDVNNDNNISSEDFRIPKSSFYQSLLKAIETKNDDWIWKNYFRITSAWCNEYFELEPNKIRLLRLDIPIYIFQGDEDTNAPVSGVYDIKEKFEQKNKANLHCYVFKGHDHNLNFMDWPSKKVISPGLQKIFDISEELNK